MSWQRSLSCVIVRVHSWQIANPTGSSAATRFAETLPAQNRRVHRRRDHARKKTSTHAMQGTGVASTVRFPRSSPQVFTNYTSHVSGRTVQFRNATTWCWSPEELESIRALQIGGDGAAAESAGVGWKIAVITISAHPPCVSVAIRVARAHARAPQRERTGHIVRYQCRPEMSMRTIWTRKYRA